MRVRGVGAVGIEAEFGSRVLDAQEVVEVTGTRIDRAAFENDTIDRNEPLAVHVEVNRIAVAVVSVTGKVYVDLAVPGVVVARVWADRNGEVGDAVVGNVVLIPRIIVMIIHRILPIA